MSKFTKWTLGIASFILIAGTVVFAVINNAIEYEEKEAQNKAEQAVEAPLEDDIPDEITEEVIAEQTAAIGGIKYDLVLPDAITQDDIVDIMHKMTHQKVMATDKWGAIPMTQETINEVHAIVTDSNFTIKQDLLEILDRWKKGDFSTVQEDHNYFWSYQGGTIGKAYNVLSPSEEAEFIKNNFQTQTEG